MPARALPADHAAVKFLLPLLCLALACSPSGRGAECASTRDCPSPLTCSAAGRCVSSGFCVGSASCDADAQCQSGLHCANGCCTPGTAGSCAKDADCSAHPSTPVCDLAQGACVACVTAADCGPGNLCQANACVAQQGCSSSGECRDPTPVCDVALHACVACLSAADCADPLRPNCDASHHCVASAACRDDGDCAKPAPKCQPGSGRCVACLSTADCPAPLVCDPKQLVCLKPQATTCTVDADCASNPAAPRCGPGGACVACTADAQCPAGEACLGNACAVRQCGADTDCAAPTARCDLGASPHSCVACLADKDCPNGGTCQPDHTCKAPANFCSADADCAQNVAAPHCKVASHSCVACLVPADCGTGKTCTAQDTCAVSTCAADADCASLPGASHCNTVTGTCVQCTTAAQCGAGFRCSNYGCTPVCTAATQAQDCSQPTPICKESAGGNACVQCVKDPDCGAGQICATSNTCVTPQTGCQDNSGCPATTPVCNTAVAPHACVQCLATPDCKNGMGCEPSAHTCTRTGNEGEICNPGGSCNGGLLCVNEGGLAGPVCRVKCDPYAPSACAGDRVCSWLGFDAAGAFFGDCTPSNNHGKVGAACDPRVGDSCDWNLLCAPRSSTTGVCAAVCNPGGSACGSQPCNAIAGAVSSSGALQRFGYCGPASRWGQTCTSDTSLAGPDCGDPLGAAGKGGLFCAPSYLTAESPAASVLALCSYTPAATTATGGASASCAGHGDTDCRTGVCLSDGTLTCFSGCYYTSDCARDGNPASTYCFDLNFVTSTKSNTVASCEPTCRDDADCAALGSGFARACVPAPTHINSSWRAACSPVAGAGKAGARCSGGTDCASGTCVTGATLEAIELGLSAGPGAARDGFCLGACSQASDCATGGTVCSLDAALPLQPLDTGDKGVMGAPHAGVCWPASCARNADCAGLSLDPATPRVCAPYKKTAYASTDNARACTQDFDCASGVCNAAANNPNPGGSFGTSAGVFGPNGKCRAVTWALECAPSLGAAKAGPGAACAHSNECQTGHCLSNGAQGWCFGACSSNADCQGGTRCAQGTYLGLSASFCQP